MSGFFEPWICGRRTATASLLFFTHSALHGRLVSASCRPGQRSSCDNRQKIKSRACDLIGRLPASGSPALRSFRRKSRRQQSNLPQSNVGAPPRCEGGSAGPGLASFHQNAPPSALAKARTERVERRTSESGDLQNPRAGRLPRYPYKLLMSLSNSWGMV